MDVHILIVILCVFFASLLSLLFINKFFRRKTFEEMTAEKRALNEKILAQARTSGTVAGSKKSTKNLKKEQKREKKQRQREQHQLQQQREDDSDEQSEQLLNSDDAQPDGLSKTHVEFDPDPVVVDDAAIETSRRNSIAEKENALAKPKSKKDKKHKSSGILVNKNEPTIVKVSASQESLNHFDVKAPKDAVELKKEKEKIEEKPMTAVTQQQTNAQLQSAPTASNNKREKNVSKKEKTGSNVEQTVETTSRSAAATKDIKQQQEVKARQVSPKNSQAQITQNGTSSSNNKSKQKKHNQKESNNNNTGGFSKELLHVLDKDNETISVSLLMKIFQRAELNRSEIQILIDYLLNKQQDMPDIHLEWSDDVLQKLKRQLEESQRALSEEQKASMGLQAKMRDLRTEHIQSAATVKACMEKVQSKEQEVATLNQEIQALNEKFNAERQQLQAKLLREKQNSSQDLLTQLQRMQGELAHKDKCIAELTCMVNATRQAHEESQQKNEIIQNQAQQIRALEQQRDELEQVSNNRVFELEKLKEVETENAERKVEICNLQNALESSKADLAEARKQIDEKLKLLNELQQINAVINNKTAEHTKEHTGLQATLDAAQSQLKEKEQHLAEFSARNNELLQQQTLAARQHESQKQEMQKVVDALKADLQSKHEKLQLVEENSERFSKREQELLHQIQEQKEKNNDLRLKNWKLIEALQSAEAKAVKATTASAAVNSNSNSLKTSQKSNLVQQQQLMNASTAASTASSKQDESSLRDLLKRLCPQAVEACAGTALSLPLNQWIEQVLTVHAKQLTAATATQSNSNNNNNSNTTTTATNTAVVSSSNKSTQSLSNNHNSQHNTTLNNRNSEVVNNNGSSSDNNGNATALNSNNKNSSIKDYNAKSVPEFQEILTENAQLRARNDELKKLVTKTSNTLSELERRALEQEEVWRSTLRGKDEIIQSLQHSNGEQNP